MNIRHFAIVALRVLGIYFLVQSVLLTQGYFLMLAMPQEYEGVRTEVIIASLFPSIVLFLAGILLVIFAPRLTNRLVSRLADAQPGNSWTLEGFQSALFSAVGLLILGSAIPPMFQWASQFVSILFQDHRGLSADPTHLHDTWTSVSLSGIQLFFGIGLFFGGRILSRFLVQLRTWSPNK